MFQSRSMLATAVGGGFEDLTELADGGVSKEFGAFPVGDVVIVEDDAFVRGKDKDVEPGIEALGVVLDTPLFACPHDFAVEVVRDRYREMGKISHNVLLPSRSEGVDLATMADLFICVGDEPVSVNAENAFGDLGQQPGKALVPNVFLASAMAGSQC